MSVGAVLRGAPTFRHAFSLVLWALSLGCGERAGDPVVALADDAGLSSAGAQGGGDQDDGNQGEGAQSGNAQGGSAQAGSASLGPTGLCGPCTNSNECGDANDACIRHEDRGFCGRDCDDQRSCPEGYDCLAINDDRLRQCVPRSGCSEATKESPSLEEVRRYVLSRVNAQRTERDRKAFESSGCLDDLAQASALEFARTDEPLGKFVKECDPIWPDCSCGWSAEAEVTLSAYALDWKTAVDHAISDPDERVARSFLADDVTQIGIGFWLSGDEVWIALSFG